MLNTLLTSTDLKALTEKDLKILKRKLPTNWVELVKAKVDFGSTKIREALRHPDNYNKVIVDAAIEVAIEYQTKKAASILKQKQRIKELGAF